MRRRPTYFQPHQRENLAGSTNPQPLCVTLLEIKQILFGDIATFLYNLFHIYLFMKIRVQIKAISSLCNHKLALVLFITLTGFICKLYAQTQHKECDIRLNAVVSSSGNLSNDGKGTYYSGKDWISIWLNPSAFSNQSFHFCMNWPYNYFNTCDSATAPAPTGIPDSRSLLHRMTNPISMGAGKSLGVLSGPGGCNDISISRPLTSTVNNFFDMAIGSSLSPFSTEVRFCNSDGSQGYSLIFGDSCVFDVDGPKMDGAGSTRSIVTRTSESTWTISFPKGTIGRLWNRTPAVPTLEELYYYEGRIDVKKQ
jgi:hypothetical protein